MEINELLEEGWTSNYAQLSEVKLHYVKAGSGPLLILLHGFPENWYSWKYQIGPFSRHYTVVAPDMRGYNLSDKPDGIEPYHVEKLVRDISELITVLGYEKAEIVGHDWGCAIAWGMALLHPEQTEKLVAICIPHPAQFARDYSASFFMKLVWWHFRFLQIPRFPEWYLSIFDYLFLKSLFYIYSGKVSRVKPFLRPFLDGLSRDKGKAFHCAINYYRSNMDLKLSNFAKIGENRVKCPTLLLFGRKDPIWTASQAKRAPETAEYIDAPFEFEEYKHIGHWTMMEDPETINARILKFLGK